MRAWTYHVPVPPDQTKIEYPDVRMDQGAFDYRALLKHWTWAAVRHADDAVVRQECTHDDGRSPMYDRAWAMMCYVYNRSAFDMPTAFLDSDAFLNQDISHIFDGDWDIGVTYRHNMGMALNEGVIFANNKRPDAVWSFFQAYLDTYHRILETPEHVAKYGNLKRWRGGQLSLNTLACPQGLPTALDYQEIAGARVAYFPCFRWNFSCERIVPEELDTKAIVHLKGARKHLLDDLIKYQENKRA
jgi:hypothetical protein